MKILVTGAAGFIGSHLCEQLLKNGNDVIGIDNFDNYYDPKSKENNVASLLQNPRFTLYRYDIRNRSDLQKVFYTHAFDTVIHLAAKAGVRPSILAVHEYMEVNVIGLSNVLDFAHKTHVKRFIFASSSSVYGNQSKIPFSESDDVSFPISPYAASKKSGELLCHSYHHLHGLEIACLRLFTVYGPRQRPDLAIHKFIHLFFKNQPIELYGNGSSLRDYTFVSDIVDGIEKISYHDKLTFEIFNLGNGNPVSLVQMVQILEKELGKSIPVHSIEKQSGDVEQTHANITKAYTFFGYQPKINIEEGIHTFLEWYLKNKS